MTLEENRGSVAQPRNVVISGASKGLGKAMAEIFAAEGSNLFMCARHQEPLEETRSEIKSSFPNSNPFLHVGDISSRQGAADFAGNILKQFLTIDVLINNAGHFIPGKIYDEGEGVLEQMLRINLYSAYHLTRALLPQMMAKKQGHIFNICSVASLKAYDNGGSYSISKFALKGFSQNLREELKQYNIKVTSVYPGAVFTSSWEGTGVDRSRIMESKDIAEIVYTSSKLSPQACVEDIVIRPQLGDL